MMSPEIPGSGRAAFVLRGTLTGTRTLEFGVPRMALSKKLRFDVFKRDAFRCQYCGKTPPAVTLEVDHITPRTRGGIDAIDNLLTACFDCNRGKAAQPLSVIPESLQQKVAIIKEREKQLRAYERLVAQKEARVRAGIRQIEASFTWSFPSFEFADRLRQGTRYFIEHLGLAETELSLQTAIRKSYDADRTLKYFCGVCWSKIRGGKK